MVRNRTQCRRRGFEFRHPLHCLPGTALGDRQASIAAEPEKERHRRQTRSPHDEPPDEDARKLAELARLCRGDILKMTTLAGSGHPGGSMSSIEMFLLLGYFSKLDPANPLWGERDRIVTSHGHTSPGMYAALGRLGATGTAPAASARRTERRT